MIKCKEVCEESVVDGNKVEIACRKKKKKRKRKKKKKKGTRVENRVN